MKAIIVIAGAAYEGVAEKWRTCDDMRVDDVTRAEDITRVDDVQELMTSL